MSTQRDDRNKRRGGFYWDDNGNPYISVTHILKIIDKPSLRYWFGKEVYYAMVKDPTLNESEALSAPYKTSDKAIARGRTIHSIVEAYKQSGAIIEDVPEEFAGYIRGFYAWIDDNKIKKEDLESEKTVYSKKYGYAGTLDLLVKIGGEEVIVDVKTGKDIYPESWLQLSAYQKALEEQNHKVAEIAILLLKEDGNYRFEKGTPAFKAFLSAKEVWGWLNRDLYTRMLNKPKVLDKGGE